MRRRGLSATEQAEARLVFGDSLAYGRVHVVEGASWTNTLARAAAWLKREPPPKLANAVGLGYWVFFPKPLRTAPSDLEAGHFGDMAWLVHELTHSWQHQHSGPGYILRAALLHLRYGKELYDYGGAQGLRQAQQAGKGWKTFNPEQQGDICRHYYIERRTGRDTTAWDPYLEQVRGFGRA